MTDPWAQTAPLTPQRPRGFSPGTVAVLATATVLLAVAGLAIGWFAAGDGDPKVQTSASPSAVISPTADASPSELPSPTPTVEPSAASPAPDGPRMPNVAGKDFQSIRRQIMADFKVTVTVQFDQDGEAGHIVKTEPAADLPVRPGTSVKLYVAGPIVDVDVPTLVGTSCEEAKKALVAAGLRVGPYPAEKVGMVTAATAEAGTKLRWNTEVSLTCETAAPPSPAAG
ncbi:PASTA domain-containing protein [Catellatospora sichuanensis]|uniref:PASTA domain-containing protein n=1 Tax=Catellatospora sichuanensis TaxID=1969805 RepID=UPI0016433BC1|nr:PASTA domain-containing protein [Catellatospora sichuanensis]